jgi:hypothetical protein
MMTIDRLLRHRLANRRQVITVGLIVTAVLLGTPMIFSAIGRGASAGRDHDPNWLRSDVPDKVEYPSGDITTMPADRSAAIKKSDALAAVTANGLPSHLLTGTPEVELRAVTKQLRGNTTADYRDRLTWVVTYRGSPPDVRGPVNLSDEERNSIEASLDCVMVLLVDADTGELYDARQYCRAPVNRLPFN